jgi:hypothetical protein
LYPPPTAGGINATLTINSLGAATFATSTGCNGTGQFGVINASLNMYSWTLSVAACGTAPAYTASGLAAIGDNPGGGTANLISVLGATAARDRSFVFAGTK